MENSNKSCSVPLCQNTSISTPQKVFIPVPLNVKIRNLWLRVAKRNPKELAGNSKVYFCEDHFNLKTDTTNYLQYGMGLSKKIEMVPGCVPTKFECQMRCKEIQTPRTVQVPTTKKILLDLTGEQKKQTEVTSSVTHSSNEMKGTDCNNIDAQEQKINAGLSEKMDENRKVFISDITRSSPVQNSCLYDLIKIVPAKPAEVRPLESESWDFVPNCDKYYVPKKKPRLKVRTVRSVRKEIEQDIYNYLPKALEQQKCNLFKKIMDGLAWSAETQLMAKNILKSDQPILRSSWQMLMNINPEKHLHSKQFVLWNGKRIQINGSKGGGNKFIYNYDLGKPRLQHVIAAKTKTPNKKKGLLQNSLTVKFKPGPLRRKKYLDDSHQKYHIGATEIVSLPKPGLDIQPFYGMTLESGIAKFVNSLRNENGIISKKWAEFAVSMLGSVQKSKAVQQNQNEIVTFDLKYKGDQNRIIMRRDFEDLKDALEKLDEHAFVPPNKLEDSVIESEIKDMMDKIINTVEISLHQENMYSGKDEVRDTICDGPLNANTSKLKRKYCELGRLDVTVIRLPEHDGDQKSSYCDKPFCTLGCVCASLECSHNIKTHCGLAGCMFQCTCDFSRYMDVNILKSGCSDFIPGLVNLDTEINLKLAKEEKKFRQTVIVSGENSILLKRQKRNWKVSKKYDDFYSNLNLKADKKTEIVLSIVNLNCKDIEPWCMVHNLYKCFCKGRFTETSIQDFIEDNVQDTVPVEKSVTVNTKSLETDDDMDSVPCKNASENSKTNILNANIMKKPPVPDSSNHYNKYICARTLEYQGRKYSDEYYKNTNNKIKELEHNDRKLKTKLTLIIKNYESVSKTKVKESTSSDPVVDMVKNARDKSEIGNLPGIPLPEGPDQSKIVAWLESNYKLCKQRLNQDITKTSLEPPREGKLTLYTWDFILHRYKQGKNFFMVSKMEPFRVFIGIDGKNSLFANCINISHIELADVHKFPVTVKNILTSACDSQEDFCILNGFTDCWEIIGSVSKLSEKCETNSEDDNVLTTKHVFSAKSLSTEIKNLNNKSENSQTSVIVKSHSTYESSKWFVMTVENDFNEIQFHTRGFFVTYSSIIKAINVARGTGKTVRLSSQKCADKGSGPQFGIYAIPDAKEYCVFVGPYEMDEQLGIETVKNILYASKDKKTRGVWITTDKLENGKVIDNPLSYMPSSCLQKKDVVDLDNNDSISNINLHYPESSSSQIKSVQVETRHEFSDSTKIQTKLTKPIKIRKSQDFYHIASNGALKKVFFKTPRHLQVSKSTSFNLTTTSSMINSTNISDTSDILINSSSSDTVTEEENFSTTLFDTYSDDELDESVSPKKTLNVERPLPVEINEKHSEKNNKTETKKMFILKPEEINKKVLQHWPDEPASMNSKQGEETFLDMDIENFLANSIECQSPDDEVLVVSDDSDDENCNQTAREDIFQEVWIQCTNIENFGCIRGRKKSANLLSFEFPGFKPTDFYEIQEAFTKINQVLSRKIYIPKNFNLQWEVIETESQLKNKDILREENLGSDFVLTKQGIRHKQELLNNKTLIKKYIKLT